MDKKFEKLFLGIILTVAILSRIAFVGVCVFFIKVISTVEPEENQIILNLPDYIQGNEWVYGFFQDFTVYGEYKYDSDLTDYFNSKENVFFRQPDSITEDTICSVIADYEDWVAHTKDNPSSGADLTEVYRFSRTMIDESDWYYFETYETAGFESGIDDILYYNYTLYYFDTQSRMLFLIHNNI